MFISAHFRQKALLVHAPELEPLYLTGGRPWKVSDKVDPSGILVRGGLLPDELLELLHQGLARLVALLQDDVGLGLDQPFAVGVTDDRGLEDGLMFHQNVLHLDG